MSKQKPIAEGIPALYKSSAEDLLLLGFVMGFQRAVPAATQQNAIFAFMKAFNVSEDDWPFESALISYQRTRRKLNGLT